MKWIRGRAIAHGTARAVRSSVCRHYDGLWAMGWVRVVRCYHCRFFLSELCASVAVGGIPIMIRTVVCCAVDLLMRSSSLGYICMSCNRLVFWRRNAHPPSPPRSYCKAAPTRAT